MRRLNSQDRPCPPPARAARKRAGSRRAPPKKLRRPWSRAARRLVNNGSVGLAGVLVVGGLVWLLSSGWAGRQAASLAAGFYRMTASQGLSVEEILVEGRGRTGAGSLRAALGLQRGDAILAFDPQAAKARLEALPWVRQAAIERRLPSLIYLRLEEHRPMALWQLDGRLAVIDETGEIIDGARPEDFAQLTLVVGPDAPEHSAQLVRLLDSAPELKRRVSAAIRVGGRRWNLRLDGGIDVRLPEHNPEGAWAQLVRIERQHGVLQRDVETIDLRLPDRLVVRTTPEAARPPAGTDGKNT
jgi:cell division protein FtsQ